VIGRVVRIWPERRAILTVVFLYGLAGALLGLSYVLLIPVLRALLQADPDIESARNWILMTVAVCLLHAVVDARSRLAGVRTAGRLMLFLQHRLGEHVARLPLGWFTGPRAGRLSRHVAQSALNASFIVSMNVPKLVSSITTPLTVVVAIAFVDWRMAVAFFLVLPLALVFFKVAGPLVLETQSTIHEAAAESAARAVEYAHAQPVLRSTGRAHAGYGPLDSALRQESVVFRRALKRLLFPYFGYVGIVQAGFMSVFAYGVYLALGGDLGAPELIALLVLASRSFEPLVLVANLFGSTRQAEVALADIEAVLTEPPLPEPSPGKTPVSSDIEFDHVRFSYDEATVFEDLSLHIPSGSTTALVGPSGSGKSTVLRLIARFWDVDGGTVRIGGVDVRDITYRELSGRMAMVLQDVYLFDATIEDNVRIARPDASDEAVRAAAETARLDEVVARLPQGWATRVGEGGAMLSGGERQRVSIARALLKDASIVLLDEITAAIDPENEKLIEEAFRRLTQGRDKTVVVIAHRLQTVASADRLVVLERGQVVETGDHEQLLARGGRYAAFWSERSRAQGWRLANTR
jgi:ATP-binding cassette subfamily B protein